MPLALEGKASLPFLNEVDWYYASLSIVLDPDS